MNMIIVAKRRKRRHSGREKTEKSAAAPRRTRLSSVEHLTAARERRIFRRARVWEFGLSAVVPRTTNERLEAVEEDTPAGPRIAANDDHSLLMRITLGERHAQDQGCGRFCPLAPSGALVGLSGSHHLYHSETGESTSPQPAAGFDDSAVGHLRVW